MGSDKSSRRIRMQFSAFKNGSHILFICQTALKIEYLDIIYNPFPNRALSTSLIPAVCSTCIAFETGKWPRYPVSSPVEAILGHFI